MHRLHIRGAFVLGCHWLPLATIDLVGDNREFEVFRHILSCYIHYSWFSLRPSKLHHCLSLVTIGCP